MAKLRKRTYINAEVELTKVLAYIRAGVKGKEFRLSHELIDPFLAELERWARDNRARVRLAIRSPEGERVAVLGVGGMAAGAILGFLMTRHPVGAVAGAGVGAAVGALASAVDLSIERDDDADGFVVALPA